MGFARGERRQETRAAALKSYTPETRGGQKPRAIARRALGGAGRRIAEQTVYAGCAGGAAKFGAAQSAGGADLRLGANTRRAASEAAKPRQVPNSSDHRRLRMPI